MSSILNTLMEGVSEIQRGNFSSAIELLEEYCQNYETNSDANFSEYIYAQQHLVKAYTSLGEKAKAIQHTTELAINGHPQVQKWAKRVLASLSPEAFESLPKEIFAFNNELLWDSESANMVLHSVNKYLEFGSDSSIIESLETACDRIKFNTKEYFYAQVLLIEAYHGNGEFKDVVSLCNQLLYSKHYLTRLLAKHYLSSLSTNKNLKNVNIEENTNKLLSPTQTSVIYQQGYNALTNKNYIEAVEIFETYCDSTLPDRREYLQASQFLVQVYQNRGELTKAVFLCLKLIQSKHKPSHRWARELLFTDLFNETPPDNTIKKLKDFQSKVDLEKNKNSLLETERPDKSPIVKENQYQKLVKQPVFKPFRLKTLDEFKSFYKQNLLQNLKIFETRRKQALATIMVCNITAFAILLFIFQLSPTKLSRTIWNNHDIVSFSLAGISVYFSTYWLQYIVVILLLSVIYLVVIILLFIIFCLFYNIIFESFTHNFDDRIIHKIYKFINTNQNLTISRVSSEKERLETFSHIQDSKLLNPLLKSNYIEQNNLIHGNINNVDIRLTKLNLNSGIHHYWRRIFDIKYLMEDVNTSVPIISLFTIRILLVFRLIKGVPYLINRIIQGKNLNFNGLQTEILKNESYNNLVFKGLFLTAKFQEFSQAVIILRPKLLKTNTDSLYYGEKKLIEIQDPELTSCFTVYSLDQVQARYILSTSLKSKLVKFYKKTNRNIYVSFIYDTIYIAIEYPDGIFEPNLFQSMVKITPLLKYFEAIHLMLEIVENLKLDRKIWKSN